MHIDWKKFAEIMKLSTPLVAALVPGGALIAPFIVGGVNEAEQLADATGAAKKQHAMGIVENGLTAVNLELAAAGKPQLNTTDVLQASSGAIETVVGIVNVVHANHPGEVLPGQVSADAAALGGKTPTPAALPQGDGSWD